MRSFFSSPSTLTQRQAHGRFCIPTLAVLCCMNFAPPFAAQASGAEGWLAKFKKSELVYSLATGLGFGALNFTVSSAVTAMISQPALSATDVRTLLNNQANETIFRNATASLSAIEGRFNGYTRSYKVNEWSGGLTQITELYIGLNQILTDLDNNYASTTNVYVEAVALWYPIAMEYVYLQGLQASNGDSAFINSFNDVKTRCGTILTSFNNRKIALEAEAAKIGMGPAGMHWYYRSSKAKFRGYFHWTVNSPTGALMWEEPMESVTDLVYLDVKLNFHASNWRSSGWQDWYGWHPTINPDYYDENSENRINQMREQYKMASGMKTIDVLRPTLQRCTRMAAKRFILNGNMSGFSSRVPGQPQNGEIATTGGFNNTAVYGPYQDFGVDVLHACIQFTLRNTGPTNNNSIFTFTHSSFDQWRFTSLFDLTFNKLPTSYGSSDILAVSGTSDFGESNQSYKGTRQELLVGIPGNFPQADLVFKKITVLGFTDGVPAGNG